MDVSLLHSLNEELAGWLSELVEPDLRRPMRDGDVGDWYVAVITENLRVASRLDGEPVASEPLERAGLSSLADIMGGGYEQPYRRSATRLENAVAHADPARTTTAGEAIGIATLYRAETARIAQALLALAGVLGLPATDLASALLALTCSGSDHDNGPVSADDPPHERGVSRGTAAASPG